MRPSKKRQALASVKLNDLLLLEELWKVLSLWQGYDFARVILNVGVHISWNRSTLVVVRAGDFAASMQSSFGRPAAGWVADAASAFANCGHAAAPAPDGNGPKSGHYLQRSNYL